MIVRVSINLEVKVAGLVTFVFCKGLSENQGREGGSGSKGQRNLFDWTIWQNVLHSSAH